MAPETASALKSAASANAPKRKKGESDGRRYLVWRADSPEWADMVKAFGTDSCAAIKATIDGMLKHGREHFERAAESLVKAQTKK